MVKVYNYGFYGCKVYATTLQQIQQSYSKGLLTKKGYKFLVLAIYSKVYAIVYNRQAKSFTGVGHGTNFAVANFFRYNLGLPIITN